MLLFVVSVVLRMVRVVLVVHVGVEAVVLVGRVGHLPDAAVRFDQTVLAVHDVAFPVLGVVFMVAGVRVLDAVFVRVMGRRLCGKKFKLNKDVANG